MLGWTLGNVAVFESFLLLYVTPIKFNGSLSWTSMAPTLWSVIGFLSEVSRHFFLFPQEQCHTMCLMGTKLGFPCCVVSAFTLPTKPPYYQLPWHFFFFEMGAADPNPVLMAAWEAFHRLNNLLSPNFFPDMVLLYSPAGLKFTTLST